MEKVKVEIEISKDHYDFLEFATAVFEEDLTLQEALTLELEQGIEANADRLGFSDLKRMGGFIERCKRFIEQKHEG